MSRQLFTGQVLPHDLARYRGAAAAQRRSDVSLTPTANRNRRAAKKTGASTHKYKLALLIADDISMEQRRSRPRPSVAFYVIFCLPRALFCSAAH